MLGKGLKLNDVKQTSNLSFSKLNKSDLSKLKKQMQDGTVKKHENLAERLGLGLQKDNQ